MSVTLLICDLADALCVSISQTKTERLLDACPWKEHKSSEGTAYFYNSTTKESVWSMPKELEELKGKWRNIYSMYSIVVTCIV